MEWQLEWDISDKGQMDTQTHSQRLGGTDTRQNGLPPGASSQWTWMFWTLTC